MARPVKWSRDLHSIRDRAERSRIETWSRQDLEALFGVGRVSAQSLMKAIGDIQTVGGTHYVERPALLAFIKQMVNAPSIDEAVRQRIANAEPAPRTKKMRISLPSELRSAMMPDLPPNITIAPGRVEVCAVTAESMLESLYTLALIMNNDLERFRAAVEA